WPRCAQSTGQRGVRISGSSQVIGCHAKSPGDGTEIHLCLEVRSKETPAIEEVLLLMYQSQRVVVHQDDFDIDDLFHVGHQFRDVHQQAAVGGETGHCACGVG